MKDNDFDKRVWEFDKKVIGLLFTVIVSAATAIVTIHLVLK